VVGLEPSCLLTLRDEGPWLLDSDDARVVAERAVLLEELLDRDWQSGRRPPLRASVERFAVHGHCHQKALADAGATARMLRRIPGAEVREIASGCCGMAGAFGYHAEHVDLSLAMGELDLLPAIRALGPDTCMVAAGTSCRAQIREGAGRQAVHPAVALRDALLPGNQLGEQDLAPTPSPDRS
jgi:Fe-S oxidoreductase